VGFERARERSGEIGHRRDDDHGRWQASAPDMAGQPEPALPVTDSALTGASEWASTIAKSTDSRR